MMLPEGGKSVLILCQYPHNVAPGQRFRFEQYLDVLRNAGIHVEVDSFFDRTGWVFLYQRGHLFRKAFAVARGFLKRILMLPRALRFDSILVYREATPLGPPFIEWLLFLMRRRVVYDFDDAIYINHTSEENRMIACLKWPSKVRFIAKYAEMTTVSTQILADWASRHSDNVIVLPSTIDPEYHKPIPRRRAESSSLVIGWTGSHTTMPFLEMVRPAIEELQKRHDFIFRVIAEKSPCFPEIRNFSFVPWRFETEIEDLSSFDIGIMPVPDGIFERGKAGFKVIQYAALEIPSVVSATGVGREVVKDGVTGIVVNNTAEEWYDALERLLKNPGKLPGFGKAAREHVLRNYSKTRYAEKYVELFR